MRILNSIKGHLGRRPRESILNKKTSILQGRDGLHNLRFTRAAQTTYHRVPHVGNRSRLACKALRATWAGSTNRCIRPGEGARPHPHTVRGTSQGTLGPADTLVLGDGILST